MYFQIVFVLNDPDKCISILDAWEGAGIRGITFLESSGIGRARQAGLRDDLPLIPTMNNMFMSAETRHRTLFAVVKDQNQVDAVVEATESIVGELELEGTGFLFVVPVSQVYGESKLV